MGDGNHKKREAEQKVKFFQDRIDRIQSDVRNLESQIAHLRQDANRAEEKAKEVSQPIDTKRTRKSIQSEIDKKKKHLDRQLPQLAEREAVEKAYLEAMDQYKSTAELITGEEDALKVSVVVVSCCFRPKQVALAPLNLYTVRKSSQLLL